MGRLRGETGGAGGSWRVNLGCKTGRPVRAWLGAWVPRFETCPLLSAAPSWCDEGRAVRWLSWRERKGLRNDGGGTNNTNQLTESTK